MQAFQHWITNSYPVYEEYVVTYVLIAVAGLLIYGAWLLSNRPTLGYHGHLVQMFRTNDNSVVRIVSADNETVEIEDLVRLVSNRESVPTLPPDAEVSEVVSALVILSPSSTRIPASPAASQEPTVTIVDLPPEFRQHVSQVYQVLHQHTDPSAAAAAIISLFRPVARRLSSQNHLFISHLLAEVEQSAGDSDISSDSSSMDSSVEVNQTADSEPETPVDFVNAANNAASQPPPPFEAETLAKNGPTFKIKFMDDTEKVVQINLTASVAEFKRMFFAEQVNDGKVIRLIYKGRLLREDSCSLQSYGVHPGCVIHCHIGSRPYAAPDPSTQASDAAPTSRGFDFDHIQQNRPTLENLTDETWANRLLRASMYCANILPFLLFDVMSASLRWIQEVERVPPGSESTWLERNVNWCRRSMLATIRLFVDYSVVQNPNVDDMFSNRFNIGVLFTLLFTLKFASIWFVVFYFPQYTDAKGVVMLTMLTVVFILYTFYNRPIPSRANIRVSD